MDSAALLFGVLPRLWKCTNEEEIVAVIAHEPGHWKLNHTIYSSCKQQNGGWECGYMVLQHMFINLLHPLHDFVNLYQSQFSDEMWHDTRETTDNEIMFC
uniref:Putative peptidase M48 n=1 Tax=Helianthus annuus TaxID=4232 RepID=A0A251UWR1_HELAN